MVSPKPMPKDPERGAVVSVEVFFGGDQLDALALARRSRAVIERAVYAALMSHLSEWEFDQVTIISRSLGEAELQLKLLDDPEAER